MSISSQQTRAKARQFGASTNEFLILLKWDFMALQGPEYHIYVQMTYFCTTIKKKSYCLKGSNSSISSQQARAKARQFGASTNEFLILLKWDSMALQGPDQPV